MAILLATRDGSPFIDEQLTSIGAQSHRNWTLIVSDDGSRDDTLPRVEAFARQCPQPVVVRQGPHRGATMNFLTMAADPDLAADYFAFCDQDDIWYADKLERALAWLGSIDANVPAVYCGRTEAISRSGRSLGLSPLFRRRPSFCNALVQSIGGGNTMVFNKATKKLLERAGAIEVIAHDWWTYQLVSGADGVVRYDPQPSIKYRQHGGNLVGSNVGVHASLTRAWMVLNGRFHRWNKINLTALRRLPPGILTPQHHQMLEQFADAQSAPLLRRLVDLRRCGVYRQTVLGNIGLIAAAVLKRI